MAGAIMLLILLLGRHIYRNPTGVFASGCRRLLSALGDRFGSRPAWRSFHARVEAVLNPR